MTQYDINKMAYQKVTPIEDINAIQKTVADFLKTHKSRFYMLLNNENRYYTIFFWKHKNKRDEATNGFHQLKSEIVEVTRELGPIKDIVRNDDTGALEFWIEYRGEPTLFVLFDYAKGVIEIE